MEALDVLARLGVVGAPVDVLHHVEIFRNVFEMLMLVGVQHLIHEVDIPEIPARSGLILHLETLLDDLLHHVAPVVVFERHDHLVYIKQCNVLESEIKRTKLIPIVFFPSDVVCFM